MKQFLSKETVWPGLIAVVAAALLALGAAGSAAAATPAPYFNGFETDTNGWTGANRVASGTNGVTSASGAFTPKRSAALHELGRLHRRVPGERLHHRVGRLPQPR